MICPVDSDLREGGAGAGAPAGGIGPAPVPEVVTDLGSLWRAFHRSVVLYGSRDACVFGDRALSYTQLHDWAAALAAGLIGLCNVRVGEKVALLAGNRPEWLPLSLAVQGTGAVEVPYRPGVPAAELVGLLRGVQAVVAIVESTELARRVLHCWAELPALRRVVVIEPDQALEQAMPLAGLESTGRRMLTADPAMLQRRQWLVAADSAAAIIHTSGTTGTPKRVLLSHLNLLHSQRCLPQAIGIGERDRVLLCMPLWHLYGRLIAYLAIGCGASLHFASFHKIEQDLQRVAPTCFPAFPPVWEQIHRRCLDALDASGLAARPLRLALRLCRRFLRLRDRAGGRALALHRRTPLQRWRA
ncbi:MAG: AMP-binding protein, partial [Nevskia sp.]|nr:AMP-binding protein [Nevskia sp.]